MPQTATHLSVILALEKAERARAHQAITALHHASQAPEQYQGLIRVYSPKDDEGDVLPTETQRVRANAEDVLGQVAALMARPWDLAATRDATNQRAVADLVVTDPGGQEVTLATAVPATWLLYLEKQLHDLRTFAAKLPVLDPSQEWEDDERTGLYRSAPSERTHSKKVRKAQVLYDATEHQPAQVESYTEDVVVGTWTATKFSGALAWTRQREILDRVDALLDAVRVARERANRIEVTDRRDAARLLRYALTGETP